MSEEKMNNQQSEANEQAIHPEGAGTATKEAPKQSPTRREPGMLPPYKVLLHNDDINTVDYVIKKIVHLTSLTTEEAVERTIEAHETGVSLLLVTHLERAELYRDQFTSVSLTVSIEPAD